MIAFGSNIEADALAQMSALGKDFSAFLRQLGMSL
jgi:hypothetical protein